MSPMRLGSQYNLETVAFDKCFLSRQGLASQLMKKTCRRVKEKWGITPLVHIGEQQLSMMKGLEFHELRK